MKEALTHPVLGLLVRRELKARYAGSTLGVLWNVIHPLVQIAVYVVIFSGLMASRSGYGGGRLGYVTHLVSGMIPWFLFSEIVSRTTSVLVDNAGFLRKTALPGEILHLSVLVNALLIHTVSLMAFAAMLSLAGGTMTWQVLLAIPSMWALGVLGMGVGMVLSVLNLFIRDVAQLVGIALNLLFWFTPIVYYRNILPYAVDRQMAWNPLLGYISLVQSLFGSGEAQFRGDYYPSMILLPFLAVAVGRRFLESYRGEILDEL